MFLIFRSLILYYHHGYEKKVVSSIKSAEAVPCSSNSSTCSLTADTSSVCSTDLLGPEIEVEDSAVTDINIKEHTSETCINFKDTDELNDRVAEITVDENKSSPILSEFGEDEGIGDNSSEKCTLYRVITPPLQKIPLIGSCDSSTKQLYKVRQFPKHKADSSKKSHESGLFLYIDFHGHASKKGTNLRTITSACYSKSKLNSQFNYCFCFDRNLHVW